MAGKINLRWAAKCLGLSALLGSVVVTVSANDTPQYDIVSIQAERTKAVGNDLMTAELSVEMEGKDAAVIASKINTAMTWALNETRKSTAVNAVSGNYYVSAVYNKNEIDHWRASQTLNLKSKDVTEMTRLIGALQSRLLMKSMGFGISPQKRDDAENELIDDAMDAFKKRAKIVTDNLGAKGYRIVNISIDSPGSTVPPRPLMMRTMAAESVSPAPAVEPGMSDITVVVSGSIQLN